MHRRNSDQGPLALFVQAIQPTLTGCTVSGVLLSIVGIYSGSPSHWTMLSSIWALTGYSVGAGIIFALVHALIDTKIKLNDCREVSLQYKNDLDSCLLQKSLELPRVIQTRVKFVGGNRNVTLLVEKCVFFGIGQQASMYFLDNGIEIFVAEGFILNIQHNGIVHLCVNNIDDGQHSFFESILDDPSLLRITRVKPGGRIS